MPVLLPNDDRWLLTLDCLFSLVYVIAGFAWLGFLRDRAAQISGSDPNRFGPASRRIHQWAGFGAVLVAAAGLADVIENALMFFSLNHSIPDAAVDGMRALAWLKWINLTLGVCFFVAASISALWRLRVERVLDAGKVGNSGVSIATLDDLKKLYSGFDLCSPSTSVSMTINGPAPMILAFFMNAAIDQQVELYLKKNELWDEARWNERRDAWLAHEEAVTDLPAELDSLSL